MDTDKLKYFCAIAETGSLTKASELLNISHSGLSKAMTVLQEELGEQVLRPQGRGLEITDAGRKLYQKSKEILELVEKLKGNGIAEIAPFVRIGLAEIFSICVVGAISSELGNKVDFYELDSGEAEVKIIDGQLDFALCFVPFPHRDLEYLKIKHVQMGVFYNGTNFRDYALEDLPFVVPNTEIKNNPLSIKSRDGWPTEIGRKVEFGSNTLSMALQIVEAGRAVVFIPQFVGKRLKLQEFEIKKSSLQDAARDIYLVKKKNLEESREMKLVAKIVRKFC